MADASAKPETNSYPNTSTTHTADRITAATTNPADHAEYPGEESPCSGYTDHPPGSLAPDLSGRIQWIWFPPQRTQIYRNLPARFGSRCNGSIRSNPEERSGEERQTHTKVNVNKEEKEMIHPQPPFGMEKEVTQVATGPHYFNTDCAITEPFGRPSCYVKSTYRCGSCPYRSDCKNAEGRS